MIEYLLAVFLVVLAFIIYKLILKPKNLKEHYGKLFRQQGLRVLELPFKAIVAPYFKTILNSYETHRDCFYLNKNEFYKYDVIVGNVLNRPQIIMINFKVVK